MHPGLTAVLVAKVWAVWVWDKFLHHERKANLIALLKVHHVDFFTIGQDLRSFPVLRVELQVDRVVQKNSKNSKYEI